MENKANTKGKKNTKQNTQDSCIDLENFLCPLFLSVTRVFTTSEGNSIL